MASGDERHVKEPAAAEVDRFPDGMRVLAVDDDIVCLRLLEALLRHCRYKPTMVMDAEKALEMLRDGEEQFDLVMTDVHMPGIDGFQLLERIGLEMDLPVIMISVDEEKNTVYKGIAHGACDYLVKPVCIKQLRNIWQHVVRKNLGAMNPNRSDSDDADQRMVQPVIVEGERGSAKGCAMNHNSSDSDDDHSSDSDDDDQRVVQPVIVEGERGGAKDKKFSKQKKNDGDGSDENKESMCVPSTQRKPRVTWTGELHRRFLEIVNHLGPDRAYPKTILKMMNVDYLTRPSVASHLQKYRIYLKRVNDDPTKYNDRCERWTSPSYMHQRWQPLSALPFRGSNNMVAAPSVLGPHGVPVQSSNWSKGTVGHGGSTLRNDVPWMPDARRCHACHPVKSSAKISDHIMMDAFSSSHSDKEYANFQRENLLETSNVVPCSHPAGNSFANMPNSGILGPVNQSPVQIPELMNAPSAVSAPHDAQFPYHVGNSSNPWQSVASSSFPGHMDGAPLIPSQVNIPHMNQLSSFGASPGQMPMFQNEPQNQMEGIINNSTTPVVGFTEQTTALLNIPSKTASVEMTSDNFSPMTQMVNGASTGSPFPNLAPPSQMVNGALSDIQGSSVAPMQKLNGGEASGTLPMQEDPVDQQALHDDPIFSNTHFMDDIFASIPFQDVNDDDFFGEEC